MNITHSIVCAPFLRAVSLIVAFTLMAELARAQAVTGQLKEFAAQTGSFAVAGAKGEEHRFRTKTTTEVLIDGKRAALKDLAVGASVLVTRGEADYAARIVSPAPVPQIKPAPPQSNVKVAATAVRTSPVTVGSVVAGQRVTVTPKKVWWTGGGSRKGSYCDWRGYEQTNVNGAPWMALVAQVGTAEFWPKDNTLSFTVPSSGALVLFANDGSVEGNEGQGQVTVSITAQ